MLIKKTVMEDVEIHFPCFYAHENMFVKIFSEKESVNFQIYNSIRAWAWGYDLMPSQIAKVIQDGVSITEDEWQSALLKLKAESDKFFSENLIPSREIVEKL